MVCESCAIPEQVMLPISYIQFALLAPLTRHHMQKLFLSASHATHAAVIITPYLFPIVRALCSIQLVFSSRSSGIPADNNPAVGQDWQ